MQHKHWRIHFSPRNQKSLDIKSEINEYPSRIDRKNAPSVSLWLRGSLKYLIIGLMVWLVVFAGIYFLFNSFIVKQITIKGNETKQTLYGITNLYNKNLFFLNSKKTQNEIYLNNPNLAQVIVTKQYPNQLLINIFQLPVVVQIKTADHYLLVDDQQRIVKKSKTVSESLPIINYYQNLSNSMIKVGDRLDYQDIKTAIFFASLLRDMGYTVNTIDINGTDMLALKISSWKLLVSLEKNKENQAELLKIIIRNFKVEGKTAKTIDLRFSKPIVEF